MFTHPAFGIDLGDGAVKAVELRRRGTRLVVTRVDYRPYARAEDGAVRPVARLPLRADEALRAFIAESRPGALDRIHVGLPSVATFNRLILVPDVGPAKIAEIARYETDRSLRPPLEDYVRRVRVLRRPGAKGEIPCLLFAVRTRLRDAFVSGLASCGLEFDNIVPAPAALAQFVLYDRPGRGDRLVLNVGLRGTDVVWIRDHGYAYRTLPLGVVGLSSLAAGAERARGLAKLAQRLAAEVAKGSTFFFGNSGRSGDAGHSGGAAFHPESALLFGEGALTPGLREELRKRLPVEPEQNRELHRISIDPRLPRDLADRVPTLGTALGLALIAARATAAELELLEPNHARDAARRLPPLFFAAAAVAFVGALATLGDVRAADDLSGVVVRPAAEDVAARQKIVAELAARTARLRRAEDAAAGFAAGHARSSPLLGNVLLRLGPEVKDYGAVDLRLVDLELTRAGDGATLELTISAPLDESAVPTVLRQRFAEIPGATVTTVDEITENRDAFLARTAYRVRLDVGTARGGGR